jgi:hypothetical protein
MKTFLLVVASVEEPGNGVRLSPGLFRADIEARPGINSMMQGAALELRRPDGSVMTTHLIIYGASVWKQPDGSFHYYGDPKDPEIKLTIEGTIADVPPGTEVWLLAN